LFQYDITWQLQYKSAVFQYNCLAC